MTLTHHKIQTDSRALPTHKAHRNDQFLQIIYFKVVEEKSQV